MKIFKKYSVRTIILGLTSSFFLVSLISSCSTNNDKSIILSTDGSRSNNITKITVLGENLPLNKDDWEFNSNDSDISNEFSLNKESTSKKIIFVSETINDLTIKIKIKNENWRVINIKEINNPDKPEENDYIDPEINPEKFVDKHLFNIDQLLKAKSVNEIITNTPLFKNSLKNLTYSLQNYKKSWNENKPGFDFVSPGNHLEEMLNDFYKLIENIGIYGDYKINEDYDYIKYYPDQFINKFMTMQRYLESPTNEIINSNNEELIINNSPKLNKIIENNIFGYLPSNLSQFLYYLQLEEIAKIFDIKEKLLNVYSVFDDDKGEITLYFEVENNKIYKSILNKNNTQNLKSLVDFKQFIYDRSFIISTNYWDYDLINPSIFQGYKFFDKKLEGTAWILDRIQNPELEKENKFEFLVGTNLHVINLMKAFSKNFSSTGNQNYDKYWNGGFVSWTPDSSSSTGKKYNDKIFNVEENGKKYEYMEKSKERVPYKFLKYKDENNIEKIEQQIENNTAIATNIINSSTIGSDNYLDLVWYTPTFESNNVSTRHSSDLEYFFGKDNYNKDNNMGNVFNGGMDFGIIKIVLSMDEIEKLFPTLHKVINTEKEKDWYIGLGNNEIVNPNNSVIIGGFPEGDWNAIQSIGGRVKTKSRIIQPTTSKKQNETQWYWARYNEEENLKMNKYNYRKDFFDQKMRDDMEHGMGIEHVLQNSILNIKTKNDKYLLGGSSGSMAIDSRFNVIGILYNLILDNNSNVPITNSIALFKHHSEIDSISSSIHDDVIKKLKSENTKTIKLNP